MSELREVFGTKLQRQDIIDMVHIMRFSKELKHRSNVLKHIHDRGRRIEMIAWAESVFEELLGMF